MPRLAVVGKTPADLAIAADLKRAVDGLQASFASEMKAKGAVLSTAQAQLLDATRDLAKERKRAQALESRMWDLDQVGQRIKNLQQAIGDEDSFDWTGRTTNLEAGPSFKPLARLPSASVPPAAFEGPDPQVDPRRSGDARQALIETRKIKQWQTRAQAVLEQRIAGVEQAGAEKEALCRRVIALCSGVPADLVEEVRHPFRLDSPCLLHLLIGRPPF
jgi:regulatory protein SWI6